MKEIEKLLDKALDSGAVDYENEMQRDYRLAKIIYHAILCTNGLQMITFNGFGYFNDSCNNHSIT